MSCEEASQDSETEEVKLLKAEVERLKPKNTKLANDLQSLQHDYVDLKWDNERSREVFEELLRKQKEEKDDNNIKINQNLVATNTKLALKSLDNDIIASY